MALGLGSLGAGGGAVRHPRCFVEIGGVRLRAMEAEVQRTAKRGCDTFQAKLSITHTSALGFDLDAWTDFEPQDVSVLMSSALGGADERVMIIGRVDMPAVSLKDHTVTISGRDLGAGLTEKRRNEKFPNHDVKQIVEKIAKDHGLQAQVSTQGGGFAGKKYEQDTAHLVLNRTDFETLSGLAEREGARWFVDGRKLFFEPKNQTTGEYPIYWYPPGTLKPYLVANVEDLTLKRNMSAARPHRVRIKSWHHRSRKLFDAISEIPGVGAPLHYEDHHSGRNEEQVKKLAKSRMESATRHELGIDFRAPGDLSVDVRQRCPLTGTGTIFDQAYEIDSVTFDMGWTAPFEIICTAVAAKEGREASEPKVSSKGGKATTTNGPAVTRVPLPPQRPAEFGGGGGTGGGSGGGGGVNV